MPGLVLDPPRYYYCGLCGLLWVIWIMWVVVGYMDYVDPPRYYYCGRGLLWVTWVIVGHMGHCGLCLIHLLSQQPQRKILVLSYYG